MIRSRQWKRLRLKVFERDKYRCVRCGKAGRLECDHIKSMKWGGDPWDMENLQALCRGCHIAKTQQENRENWLKRNPDSPRSRWQKLLESPL